MKRTACFTVAGVLLVAAAGCDDSGTSGTQDASTVEVTVPVTDVEPVLPSVEGPLIRESHPRPQGNYDTLLTELAGTFVLRNDCIYIEDVEHHSTVLLIFLYSTTWDPATQAIGTFGHVGDSFLKAGSSFDPPREVNEMQNEARQAERRDATLTVLYPVDGDLIWLQGSTSRSAG